MGALGFHFTTDYQTERFLIEQSVVLPLLHFTPHPYRLLGNLGQIPRVKVGISMNLSRVDMVARLRLPR